MVVVVMLVAHKVSNYVIGKLLLLTMLLAQIFNNNLIPTDIAIEHTQNQRFPHNLASHSPQYLQCRSRVK